MQPLLQWMDNRSSERDTGGLAMFHSRYKRDLDAARGSICTCGSCVAETRLGPIEYIASGEGPPVLLVHGVVGGCDQGPDMAQAYLGAGFRTIAVSRFGYLRSPLPEDSSPAAQADLYAALLDTLGIRKVALVGTSAGGPSSLQFGLRHPDRCAALVLWSMAVPPYTMPARPLRLVMEGFFGSDLAFWSMITYTPSLMLNMMGVPRAVQTQLTAQEHDWLSVLMRSFLPISLRVNGIMNDICITNPSLNNGYPLERIAVPVLVIHAVDDPMPSFAGAKRMADHIPQARFITINRGGHLLLGHHEQVRAEITEFIRARPMNEPEYSAVMVY
jgi:pimeloyl-ACP methyl ester carboxylesterase